MQEDTSFDVGAAVAAAKSTLTVPEPALGQPALVMLCGLPGTGKSTLARRLDHRLPAVVIESDRLRRKLFPQPTYTAEESRQVHTVCHILMGWYLRHYYHVVYDATNLYEYHRRLVYRLADRSGARLLVMEVTANDDVIRERLAPRRREDQLPARRDGQAQRPPGARDGCSTPRGPGKSEDDSAEPSGRASGRGLAEDYSDADWEVYLRMRRRAEPIQHEHIILDTSDGDVEGAVKRILEAVRGQ
jgi:predicted kinase